MNRQGYYVIAGSTDVLSHYTQRLQDLSPNPDLLQIERLTGNEDADIDILINRMDAHIEQTGQRRCILHCEYYRSA